MRKTLPLIVVGILVLSGLGAVAISSNEETELTISSVSFSEPMIEIEKEYVSINIEEANSFIMKQGKPMLPSYTDTFVFPFGTKILSVTCSPINIETQTLSKKLEPTPKAVIVGQTVSTTQKEIIDYGTEVYPSSWFTYAVSGGLSDGELSVIVDTEVSPIKYHPSENTIEIAKDVSIEIEYELPDETTQPSNREEYDLIVIGPDEFSDEIAPLITHKNGRGVSAKFVGLSEVYTGQGRDNQEKIKYYIKDAIETTSTGNVLLVGSSLKLPVRMTHVYIEEEDPPGAEVFASDLYYADIYDGTGGFCSWDSNGNDVFGELDWNGNTDDVDLNPDIYLGRIACRSGTEVTTLVNKIKTYENNVAYQQDWFLDMVVLGGDTSPDYETVEGEYINQKVIDMMDGFIPEKLWVTNGKLTSWVPTGLANIKNAINEGCGFVDFSGHGNTNVWATHPEESHNWVPTPNGVISSSDLATLNNGNELPIVAVEACSTAKFASDSNCFNWAFLHNPNGGAIATFGATALGWGYVGTGIAQGLIGKMGLDTFRAYKLDEAETLGEMWAKALDRYIDSSMENMDYKTTEEWQPMGDPTLAIGEESNPPLTPDAPDGTASGSPGTMYTYTASTTDPDGDKIEYLFDWGDDTTSGWVGPLNSGATASADKSWSVEGTYQVKVVAKDSHGKLSSWSDPLYVVIPRSKTLNTPFSNFLQQYPNILPILRQLLLRLGL